MGIKGRVVGSACCLGRPVVAAGAVVFVVCRNFLASVRSRENRRSSLVVDEWFRLLLFRYFSLHAVLLPQVF